MKRVIIESPFRGANAYQQERNRRYALLCMKDSIVRGEAPFLSHLLYTQVLDDRIKEERDLGISAGLVWGELAELTVVYIDNGISEGMQFGIDHAASRGRSVEYRTIADGSQSLEKYHKIKLTELLVLVSDHFNIPIADLVRKTRERPIVDARFVFCAVARELHPKLSYQSIGYMLGYKDHAAVMNAIMNVNNVKDVRDKYLSFCESKNLYLCLQNQ